MKLPRRLPCSLFAALGPGVFLTSVQAQTVLHPMQPYQQPLPDNNLYTAPVDQHNHRWDFLYWSPTTGTGVPNWNANSWARFYNYFYTAGNPVPVLGPGDRPFYAVFWNSANFGPTSGFKTVNVDADSVVRGLHFRNQGWTFQDTGQGNTLTLIGGTFRPYNDPNFDDRETITLDAGAQAILSANVVLGAFVGSSWASDGRNQFVAMGAHSAFTMSGNISETGDAKTLNIGSGHGVALGSAFTLAGNNTFTGGVIFKTVGGPTTGL